MNLAYRIMTLEAFQSRRITHTMTDSNREFVTLMACICADGTSTPVSLIYKGKSHDLQDSWVDQIEETDEVYFAASANRLGHGYGYTPRYPGGIPLDTIQRFLAG
jgi:hypothetical protein